MAQGALVSHGRGSRRVLVSQSECSYFRLRSVDSDLNVQAVTSCEAGARGLVEQMAQPDLDS